MNEVTERHLTVPDLDYDELTFISTSNKLTDGEKRNRLLEVLWPTVESMGFDQPDEDGWPCRRTKTFLADGWTSAQSYFEMKLDELFNKDELGRIVNLLIRGKRPNNVMETPEGEAAALLFFCSTKPPK